MTTEETKDLATTEPTALAAQGLPDQPLGFEDDNAEDLIIPRIKCLQALSPEVQDGVGKMGTIINSLTLDNVTDRVFVPVCKFNNHILWRDRNDGGGIICRAADGKIGVMEDGTTRPCAACRKCEFDNTKKGREALPTCTKYINFLGFFEDDFTPIILSFSKTNMAEGKQMYSMAKVSRQNIWNFGYKLTVAKKSNNTNSWFIIKPVANGATSDEIRQIGMELYRQFAGTMTQVTYDVGETQRTETTAAETQSDEDMPF